MIPGCSLTPLHLAKALTLNFYLKLGLFGEILTIASSNYVTYEAPVGVFVSPADLF